MRGRAAILEEFSAPFTIGAVELREPGPRQLVVRSTAVPFCATDWMGWLAMRRKVPPVVLGHTAVGVVEQVGHDAARFRPGDRVLVAATPECGRCFYCRVGRPDQCATLMEGGDPVVGVLDDGRGVRAAGRVGGYAELLLADDAQVHHLPEEVSDVDASLLGCGISTAFGAIWKIGAVQPGQSVAILGLGQLGLWAVQAATLAGAESVLAIDRNPHRREVASALGATQVIDAAREDVVAAVRAATDGRGADLTFEAAGPPGAARDAVLMTRRAGTIVLSGVDHAGTELTLPQLDLTVLGKRVLGCQNGEISPAVDLPRWIELLRSGQLATEHIVTGRFGISDIDEVARRSMSSQDITAVFTEF